jgi:Putative Ig domain
LAQTLTAMWDPSPAAQQVTGYEVCVGTSSLSCDVRFVAVSAASTSYAFAPTPGVRHYVAIRARNAAGLGPFSSEVTFSTPSFAQPANQIGSTGVSISPLSLSIVDPDGSPLTITHTGLPVGLSIDAASRQITGTPIAPGSFNVTVFVSDGLVTVSRSFNWAVSGPDYHSFRRGYRQR